jgi:selenophosphate synthetase-related protein
MLKKVAESIINNRNILEKQEIESLIQFIDSNSFKSERIFSDIGEDSASIKNNNQIYTLITTDRIKTTFIENFPFGAGFSAILVGVDDIYASGGKPIAVSVIISFKDKNIGQKLIEGICDGSKKFQVPIVRGHTNMKDFYELSSTMVGEVKAENYISAKNAQFQDDIILAVDFDGKVGKANNMYWDTTTFKSPSIILKKRSSMNLIAEKHLAHSSKDISNAGIFGTIIQLVNYSKIGAKININNINIPPILFEAKYNLLKYSQMFLTTSFILSSPKKNSQEIIEIFKNHTMEACKIGEITKERNLTLSDNKKEIKVMDL